MSVNLNRPMQWGTFVHLSKQTQEEYITNLISKYNVSNVTLAPMFGVCRDTVCSYLKNNLGIQFRAGTRMTRQQKEAWLAFLASDIATATEETHHGGEPEPAPALGSVEDTTTTSPQNTATTPATDVSPCAASVENAIAISFSGMLNASAIVNSIVHMLSTNKVKNIDIKFVVEAPPK